MCVGCAPECVSLCVHVPCQGRLCFHLSSQEARICSGLVLWVPSPLHRGVSPQGGGPARLGLADCMGRLAQHAEGLSVWKQHLPDPFRDEDSSEPLPEPQGPVHRGPEAWHQAGQSGGAPVEEPQWGGEGSRRPLQSPVVCVRLPSACLHVHLFSVSTRLCACFSCALLCLHSHSCVGVCLRVRVCECGRPPALSSLPAPLSATPTQTRIASMAPSSGRWISACLRTPQTAKVRCVQGPSPRLCTAGCCPGGRHS